MDVTGGDETFTHYVDRLVRSRPELKKAAQRSIEFVEGFQCRACSGNQCAVVDSGIEMPRKDPGFRPYRIVSGYDQILDAFAHHPVHFKTTVKEIHWEPEFVRVHTIDTISRTARVYEAKAIIVTLPLSVLQSTGQRSSIAFMPHLPNKKQAADALRMGNVVKVVLVFEKPF
jgi:monoamine oxidase